jgi:hypothetical protein
MLASLLLLTSIAGATHTRPKGASPLRISYVVAYDDCNAGAPPTVHDTAFGSPSCPPVESSTLLREGTPDANGLPAGLVGSTTLSTTPPAGDIKVVTSITDVHCGTGGGPGCPMGPFPGGYGGTVGVHSLLKITDHCNHPPPPGGGCPAPPGTSGTTRDLPFLIGVPCGPVPAPPGGSTCSITTTYNTVLPGAIVAGQRMNIRMFNNHVLDGGADADGRTADAASRVFLTEGMFVP